MRKVNIGRETGDARWETGWAKCAVGDRRITSKVGGENMCFCETNSPVKGSDMNVLGMCGWEFGGVVCGRSACAKASARLRSCALLENAVEISGRLANHAALRRLCQPKQRMPMECALGPIRYCENTILHHSYSPASRQHSSALRRLRQTSTS
jgi:hypothetical protein